MIKKLVIQYDGSEFSGWQRQNTKRTVQGTIEKLLSKIYNTSVTIDGSGRTDAKVHSLGQVATFECTGSFTEEKLKYVMNNLLPGDIYILDVINMEDGFHGRYSVKSKRYIYKIHNTVQRSVFDRKYAYEYPHELDLEAMKRACRHFLGEHDFTTFRAQGSSNTNPVRVIYDIQIRNKDQLIEIDLLGNGFLYKMVRIIVATLLDVGIHKINENDIPSIIMSRDRNLAKRTAPAHGLYLAEVNYDE